MVNDEGRWSRRASYVEITTYMNQEGWKGGSKGMPLA